MEKLLLPLLLMSKNKDNSKKIIIPIMIGVIICSISSIFSYFLYTYNEDAPEDTPDEDTPNKKKKSQDTPDDAPYVPDCTYKAENAVQWGDIYSSDVVKAIDNLPSNDKKIFCTSHGNCWNPKSGRAWCFKPINWVKPKHIKKDCTYKPENATSWKDFYSSGGVKVIDGVKTETKEVFCTVHGNCWNPKSGGAWCFKPANK